MAQDTLDPLEKFQRTPRPAIPTVDMISYWHKVSCQNGRDKGSARMGLEMATIPAMSTEPE